MTYNGLSQPLTVTGPAVQNPISTTTHTQLVTFHYDAAGRRTSQAISDPTGGDTTRTTGWGYEPAAW